MITLSKGDSYQCRGGGVKHWEPIKAVDGHEAALTYADRHDLGEGNTVSVKGIGIYHVAEIVSRSVSLGH